MQPHPDAFFVILMFILGFSAVMVQAYFKTISHYFRSFFSTNRALQVIRDENDLNRRVSFGLETLSHLVIALYVVVLIWHYKRVDFEVSNYYVSTIVYLLIFNALLVAKKFFIWMISKIYEEEQLGKVHQVFFSLSLKSIGVFLIPIIFLIVYGPPETRSLIIYLSWIILVGIYSVLIFRLLNVAFKSLSFPKFYSFLYLCALEIFPVLIIIRLLS